MDVSALKATLSVHIDANRILIREAVPPRYRLDALRPHHGARVPEEGVSPAAVVFPIATEEVSATLRVTKELGFPIIAWGGGTGLMGGARPRSDSVVIDLRRMRRVRAIDRVSCTATAEAGIILEELHRRLRRRGLTFGHDPWSRPRATLGGSMEYVNGVGSKLAHLMGEELGSAFELAQRVKRCLDPDNRLNPGKAGL